MKSKKEKRYFIEIALIFFILLIPNLTLLISFDTATKFSENSPNSLINSENNPKRSTSKDIEKPKLKSKVSEEYTENYETFPKKSSLKSTIEYEEDLEGELFKSARDDPTIEWKPIENNIDFSNLNTESFSDLETEAIGYNPITNEEKIIPITQDNRESTALPTKIEPYEGLLSTSRPESVIGSDDRSRITNTDSYPWRTICKVYITFPSGNNFIGSAMIIDDYHILTAGHVVYDDAEGGWASSLEIVPGQDNGRNGDWPYHHAWVTYMRSYTGWTEDGNHKHDWAMCTLDRNVGSYTGWMGRQTADKSNSIYTGTLNVAGYPGDLDFGRNMYWDAGSGDKAEKYTHWYYMDTAGGMSGGPVWRYDGSNRYILSIHAYGTGGSWDTNHGTRLNNDKYDRIFDWQAEDTAPTDKPDMRDRGSAYRSVSSTDVTAGVDSLTINCDIENVGTDNTNGFYIRFYASTNDYISEYDHYLGYDYISNLGAFSNIDSSWSDTVPSDIPEGDYYIGWIIDRDDNRDEFDETNNRAFISSKIHIEGNPPPSGYIEVTVQDSTTSNPISSASIYVENSSDFIDSGSTDSSGFYNITRLPVDTYYIHVSKVGYFDKTVANTIDFTGDDDYLTIELDPKPRDSGYAEVRVRDTDSNPVLYPYIEVINMSSNNTIDSGYGNSNGFYNATGLTTGDWFEIHVSDNEHKSQSKQTYMDWNGDDDYLYFYLEENPPDSGYIEVRTYESVYSHPIKDVYVECVNDTSGILIDTGYTDSNGFYNITGLTTNDTFTVNVSKPLEYYEQSRSSYINWNGDDDYLNFYLDEIIEEDKYEENDDSGTAYNLSNYEGTWLSSVDGLGVQLDDDWYEIYIDPGELLLNVELIFNDFDGDIEIILYNSTLDYIAGGFSSSDNEYLNVILSSGGTYFLKIYYGDLGNSYDLRWEDSVIPSDDNYEENDVDSNAYNLTDYEAIWLSNVNGSGVQKDDDWYEIYASSGDLYLNIELKFDHSKGDIDIALYNSSMDWLTHSISSTNNEYIQMNVSSVGKYYLRVYYGNAANSYNLRWESSATDTYPPIWDLTPTDQTINVGDFFSYTASASDPSGIDDYWVDDINNFNISSNGLITNQTALSVGKYSLQINVNDTSGNKNSESIQVYVRDPTDNTPPTWDELPQNQTTYVGLSFAYDVNASDPSGIDDYEINDTANFNIDSDGLIQNETILSEGIYGLELSVSDVNGNKNTTIISINVILDETPPTWEETPTDQTVNSGQSFSYDVNATDTNGIDYYWVNDTGNFRINSNGLISNTSTLSEGIYALEIRAYDPAGNFISETIKITVSPSAIPGFELGLVLGITIISVISVFISKKRRIQVKK